MTENRSLRVRYIMSTVSPRSFGLGPVALNLVREQRALGLDAQIWCPHESADIEWAWKSAVFHRAQLSHRTAGPRFLGGDEEVQLLHQHGIWTAVSRAANAWRPPVGRPTEREVSQAAIGRALEKTMTTIERISLSSERGRNLVRSRYTWDAAAA